MAQREHHKSIPTSKRLRFWLVLGGFLAVAAWLLWEEHRVHMLGALPWLILLACPLLHVFMHGGHGGHGSHHKEGGDEQ